MLQKEQIGRVLRLTLHRAEKRNAIDRDLCLAVLTAVDAAVHDCSVGAILLTGNGPSFCAGMDLTEAAAGPTEETNSLQERLFTLGSRISKPLIAAVQGAALGGGMGLVANCHIVVADSAATFGLTEVRLGLWPFLVFRAVALALGERRTLELALTGRIFDSVEAHDLGLVHEITPDPASRAFELAETVAGFSPTAVQNGMSFVQEVRGMSWTEAGKVAGRIRDRVFAGADYEEGLRAFREKRPPRWPSLRGSTEPRP